MAQDETVYEQAAARAFSGETPPANLDALGPEFVAEFRQAEVDRRITEERWLQDLRQFKGKYDPDEEARIGSLRSKAYVRKTRVKVKTLNSRVADLLFPAGSNKNWSVEPTPKPTISREQRAKIIQELTQAAQAAIQAGQSKLQNPVPPEEVVDQTVMELAKKASKEMGKVINDQLVESRYKQQALQVINSGHLYGTGVLKGPLVERKVRTRFNQVGENWVATQESYVVPFVDYVPLWRIYPDMAATTVDTCRFIYERHTFTRDKLFALTKNPSFNKDVIISYLAANPKGLLTLRYYDNELKAIGDRHSKQGDFGGQYEVLERWGWIDGVKLKHIGVNVPPDREQEAFFANVWLLPNGEVIKAVLQPINGVTWPYHFYYFDKDETSIFGEGLATVMRDDQKMVNAATRMMLDNGALTSGPMYEVFVDLLSSMEDVKEIAPWKAWLRNGKNPEHSAIRPVELPNNLEFLEQMARMFDANIDETTAIPRYMTGENATQGAAGTASGMSMLMGAANIVVKDLLTGYDEGITIPFIQALYRWNMQFSKDAAIKGDFDVNASGTASLVAKEVRAQQLNEFAAMTNDPADAPFIKRQRLLELRAEALEMNDVVKTQEEVKAEQDTEQAKAQAQLQQQMMQAQLAELQGKAAKLMADATTSAANAKLLEARASEALANIDAIVAKTVETRVATIYSALQAGGVATNTPYIAPAGDEILKSSGFKDQTPDPSIAQLNSQPVQAQDGTTQVLNKGQTFQEQPRGTDPVGPPPVPEGQPQPGPSAPQVPPQTGEVGLQAGIETPNIEGQKP